MTEKEKEMTKEFCKQQMAEYIFSLPVPDREAALKDLLARIRRCNMHLVAGGKKDPPSDNLRGDFNL